MTPERLQSWIYRPVTNSRTLVLVHEPMLGQSIPVATWTREEVEALREQSGSQGEEVLTLAREHMEASGERETCKFVLQWYGERKAEPLRSTIIRLKPDDTLGSGGDITTTIAADAAAMSGSILQAIVPQLLSALEKKDRLMNGSTGIILAAYERALAMQQRSNDFLQTELAAYLQLVHDQGGGAHEPDEFREARARAIDKLVAVLPDFLNKGVAIAAHKLGTMEPPTREQKKAVALQALNALDPEDIAELVTGGASSDGEAPQH